MINATMTTNATIPTIRKILFVLSFRLVKLVLVSNPGALVPPCSNCSSVTPREMTIVPSTVFLAGADGAGTGAGAGAADGGGAEATPEAGAEPSSNFNSTWPSRITWPDFKTV